MKFFLQKSSISTHIPSLTGRGMAVEKSVVYKLVVQKTSFTPNFNNRTTSVASGYGINNNLITLLN
jgi:hypothetical protein